MNQKVKITDEKVVTEINKFKFKAECTKEWYFATHLWLDMDTRKVEWIDGYRLYNFHIQMFYSVTPSEIIDATPELLEELAKYGCKPILHVTEA